jgi:hypothetical protein
MGYSERQPVTAVTSFEAESGHASPTAEKATASQDQAGQASTGRWEQGKGAEATNLLLFLTSLVNPAAALGDE